MSPHPQSAVRRHRRERRAQLTAEALIIIPILLTISIAIVELGLILSLKQSVVHAAIAGGRVAAQGAELADVELVIEEALSGFDVLLASNAGYLIEIPGLSTTISGGSIDCSAPTSPLGADKVRVTVCANSTGSPVSGLIARFGAADLIDKILTESAVAKRECP